MQKPVNTKIPKKTLSKLRKLRTHPREPYYAIIERLLEAYKK